jgi:hypothetical protein
LLESFWLNLRNGFPILVFLTWFSRSLAGPARIPVPFTQDVRPEGPQDLDNSYINHYLITHDMRMGIVKMLLDIARLAQLY